MSDIIVTVSPVYTITSVVGVQGPQGVQGEAGAGVLAAYTDAMDAANLPSAANAFATIADVPSVVGLASNADSRLVETRTDLVPSAGAAGNITLNLSLGRSFKIDCSTNSPTSLTIVLSNVPAGTALTALSLLLVTGAGAVPTVIWPAGVTAPTLTASKTAWFTLATADNGTTTRLFSAGAF